MRCSHFSLKSCVERASPMMVALYLDSPILAWFGLHPKEWSPCWKPFTCTRYILSWMFGHMCPLPIIRSWWGVTQRTLHINNPNSVSCCEPCITIMKNLHVSNAFETISQHTMQCITQKWNFVEEFIAPSRRSFWDMVYSNKERKREIPINLIQVRIFSVVNLLNISFLV